MKTLAYISPDCFFDNDLAILKELQKEYVITWHAFMPKTGGRYTEAQLLESLEGSAIHLQIHWTEDRRRSLKRFFLDWSVLNQIRRERADLVYIVDLGDIYWNLIQPFKLKKTNTVYALHDAVFHPEFKGLGNYITNVLSSFARCLLTGWCQHFHFFSKTQYTLFKEKHFRKHCFYSQLPMKGFGTSTVFPLTKSGVCKFLFFGAIEYYKGLDALMVALEQLHAEGYSNFSLTVAGQGKYWSECEKQIKSPDIYDLRIGFVHDNEIADLFSTHHFLVLPYRSATQSGPLTIAFNYTLPIVASNVDGLNDLLENTLNAMVFENDDPDSLKETLKQCINMNSEEYSELKVRIGDFAKEHLSINNIKKDYVRFFDSIQ